MSRFIQVFDVYCKRKVLLNIDLIFFIEMEPGSDGSYLIYNPPGSVKVNYEDLNRILAAINAE